MAPPALAGSLQDKGIEPQLFSGVQAGFTPFYSMNFNR